MKKMLVLLMVMTAVIFAGCASYSGAIQSGLNEGYEAWQSGQ